MIIVVLLIVICILNCIDYWQTIHATQLFGLGVEANPIARFMFENNCEWIKLLIVPIALIGLWTIIKTDKRFIWTIYALLIFYAQVVINNFIVLFNLGAF